MLLNKYGIIYQLLYRIFKARGSGLLKTPPDTRDLKTETLGWFGYTPKNQKVFIPPISIKDQSSFNTCQFNATVARKERDEGVPLSVRAFVAYAAKHGYLSGDGWSDMRSGEKILAEWGCPDEVFCANLDITERRSNGSPYSWNEYVNIDLDALTENANLHRSKTYWSVSSVNDVLKLLDDGRCVKIGMDWYTGFNQGGGFNFPWLIKAIIGYLVGGHAIVIDGYDQNYQNFKVHKIQNSYGIGWGDKGHFYITWDLITKFISKYGAYTDLDIEKSVADILIECAFKNVKGTGTVYYIYAGKKHGYPDLPTFYSWGFTEADIVKVNQADLDKIPDGDVMKMNTEVGTFINRCKNNPYAKKKLIELLNKL